MTDFNKTLFYNPYREHLNRLEAMSLSGAFSGVGRPLFEHQKTIFQKMAEELDEKNQQRFQLAKDMASSGLHPDYPREFPYNFS